MQFLLSPGFPVRNRLQCLVTALKMCNRFKTGRSLDRPLTRSLPISNGKVGKSGLREVAGQQLGLCFDCLGKTLFQGMCYPGMQLLAFAAQERPIGRVLDKRMLERIGRLRRQATA